MLALRTCPSEANLFRLPAGQAIAPGFVGPKIDWYDEPTLRPIMSNAFSGPTTETLADLIDRLGGVPLDRIRYRPFPGTATEQDVVQIEQRENRLCELVEGVLVEKPMGFRESLLALALGRYLHEFVTPRKLGLVIGSDGMLRLGVGLVRIPDVGFVSWENIPGRSVPIDPIPELTPDLAVEVLSRSNTSREMTRKLNEYFEAGVKLIWIVDPERRMVTVHRSPNESKELTEAQSLDGAGVLPGFSLELRTLFSELDRSGA